MRPRGRAPSSPPRTKTLTLPPPARRCKHRPFPASFPRPTTIWFRYIIGMPRCALYARTSTADKGQTPQTQLRQLRTFARSQGWQVAAEFIDLASGTRADRPQFQAMLEAASRREFDLLLFWSLDRFSREGILETLTSLKRLSDYGVKYRSLQESYIDTTNPFGDLLAAFVAKIAALERERIPKTSGGTGVNPKTETRKKVTL